MKDAIQPIYGLEWENMIFPGQVSGSSFQISTVRRNKILFFHGRVSGYYV